VRATSSEVTLIPAVREGFAAAVRESLGLVFPPSRAPALDRGIASVAALLGEPDGAVLLGRLLDGDPAVREALIVELTVGETYLFRDDSHFDFVRDVAIPEAARRGGPVRLWSAGCATGEEAWSLAITAHEALGAAEAARVEVLGTDLNPRFLERARRGWYGPWSFRGVDPARRERWFRAESNGWSVAPEVRPAVRFAPLNLLDAASTAWPLGVDVIFCRNVAIYFDLETVGRIAASFARSLLLGGWLVPGPSDPLLPTGLGLTATIRGPLVYRRANAREVEADPRRELQPAPAPAPPGVARRSSVPPLRSPLRAAALRASPTAPTPTGRAPIERARDLADAGDLAGATRWLDEALVLDGLNPALFLLRSTVRQAAGDDLGACHDAEKAIVIDRSLAFAHVLLAAGRVRLSDRPAALRALRNARALLLAAPPGAPVPHGGAQRRDDLLSICDRLGRALGVGVPANRRG
jgi:chemotaxis protein methyltransferase CheR